MKKNLLVTILICFTFIVIGCQNGTADSINTTTTTTKEEEEMSNITYNRKNPNYYKPGTALLDQPHVVYINFDAFAHYYFEELIRLVDENTVTLKKLFKEGVYFEGLKNALPSVTNPTQNQILSGATSAVTKNVYRYYDRNTNKVIQQARENESDTIVTKALENELSVVSVHHYLAEQYLTGNNPEKLYVTSDNTNPKVVARGNAKYGDHFSRFEQLTKVITGKELKNGGAGKITVSKLPNLTLFYADDLDAIGHNMESAYGYPLVDTEEKRMDKVITLLKEMDAKLGEFIQECKTAGVYDKLTFFLTADHGMNSFGLLKPDDNGDYGASKLGDLIYELKKFDSSYSLELVAADKAPKASTSVVGVGMNLNIQFTFKKGITDQKLNELKAHLEKLDYVGKVQTKKELEEAGYWTYAADMIVTPKERYCFSGALLTNYVARGQHDSSLDTAHRVFGLAWGKGIKKNFVYQEMAFNYDFGTTMAAALGIILPKSNGVVLDIFEK